MSAAAPVRSWRARWRRPLALVAWLAVALAWTGLALGFVGPRLGGAGPGLTGPVGFAVDAVAALWLPGGVLALATALLVLWCGRHVAAAGLGLVAGLILAPTLWAWWRAPGPAPVPRADAVRIAAVNLCDERRDDPSMAARVRALDAHVLVLVEFTPDWARQLEPGFVGDYPQRWLAAPPEQPDVRLEGMRIAVWSRLPAAGPAQVRVLGGVNAQLRVPLRWQGREFALYGIHPWKPVPYGLFAHAHRDRQELLDWIGGETLPTVVAGDCNAAPRSAFLQRLVALGLDRASASVQGEAPATWPVADGALATVAIAIDHILHSPALVTLDFQRGPASSSDHLPVVATLAWRRD